jgi:hypothetical protein
MITEDQAKALLKTDIQSITDISVLDELLLWINCAIGNVDAQLDIRGNCDAAWYRRAKAKKHILHGHGHAAHCRRKVLAKASSERLKAERLAEQERLLREARERKAEIKRRNIEDNARQQARSSLSRAQMFVDICRQTMPDDEYLRIWAAVGDAMAESEGSEVAA